MPAPVRLPRAAGVDGVCHAAGDRVSGGGVREAVPDADAGGADGTCGEDAGGAVL